MFRVDITPAAHPGRGTYCSVSCRADAGRGKPKALTRDEAKEACRRYNSGESSNVIARDFGVSGSTVALAVRLAGGKMRKFTANAPLRVDIPVAKIAALYAQGSSTTVLGKIFGCSAPTIANRLKRAGVKLRGSPRGGGYSIRCKDGHVVRSNLERLVDDWLYGHEIAHAYEPELTFNPLMTGDFLARGVYIEVWGMEKNQRYNQRKQEKLAQYAAAGASVISLLPDQVENHLNSALDSLLEGSPYSSG